MTDVDVASNFRRVQERVERAAERAGRKAADVSLVAVAKTKPAAMVAAAIAAGARLIGENYVQEAKEKRPLVSGAATWHLIGHLQRNKARLATSLFDVIQTLDSTSLAGVLDRLGAERGAAMRVLVEVNLGGEASKSGVAPVELEAFLASLAPLANLRVEGLMAIPPPDLAPRPSFAELRRLRDRLAGQTPANVELRELSMGMTDDFEIAIEEGATLVRVGRAIFGERSA